MERRVDQYLSLVSVYDVMLRFADLGIMRLTKRAGYWGRITRNTSVEVLAEDFEFEYEADKPPEDETFVLDDLLACSEMDDGLVDMHVYITEVLDEEVQMVTIREQPMAKREYVVRDSANHAYTIAFMGPYADSNRLPWLLPLQRLNIST